MSGLARLLALLLIAGTVCVAAGAAFHPMLTGDPAADLRLMAATPAWRTIHLVMLAGSGLVAAGIWVRVVGDRRAEAPLVAALATIALGVAINALDIAYMAGAGTRLAAMLGAGRTDAVTLFEVTHPIGRMMARFGNFVVALGALALGAIEWGDASRPKWLAALAWLAAGGGLVGVICFNEESPLVLAAVALLCGWQVATAVRALGRR